MRVDLGAVYVFTRSGATWTQQQTLTANDGVVGNLFGASVAISGNTLVVGAPGDAAFKGAAYVFNRSGSTFTTPPQKLIADGGAPKDFFGLSVAIDGNTLVAGAPFDTNAGGVSAGSAYVFNRSGTDFSPIPQQKLTAFDGKPNADFGFSVAIDVDTLVVGAVSDSDPNKNQGAAYVFTRSGSTFPPTPQKLTAFDGAENDGFGASVAIDGDTLVAGAPGDDNGANINQGSAYVFTRSGTDFTLQQKLMASDGKASDAFGASVAIDGDTLVAGGPLGPLGDGAAHPPAPAR